MHCHQNNIILSAATRLSSTSSIQLLPTVSMSTSSFIVSQILPCQASSSLTTDHITIHLHRHRSNYYPPLSSGFRHNLLNHEGGPNLLQRVTTPDNNLISPLEPDYYFLIARLWNELWQIPRKTVTKEEQDPALANLLPKAGFLACKTTKLTMQPLS